MSTETTTSDQRQWDWALGQIRDLVVEANTNAGVEPLDFDGRIVTFGYIGNLGRFGDDRSWTVWVKGVSTKNPQPTTSDAVPYFRTGDIAGAQQALTFVKGFVAGQTTRKWS